MTEKRKVEVLCRLRETLGQRAHPTLRETGLPAREVQELLDEELIVPGDKGAEVGADADRYVVAELTDKAILYLSSRKAYPMTRVETHAPPRSSSARIAAGTASRLWDLLKVAFGILLGWWLKKQFP